MRLRPWAVAGALRGQGDVVEQTEAHAVRRCGVMAGRPHQAQSVAIVALHDGVHGGSAGAGRRQRDAVTIAD